MDDLPRSLATLKQVPEVWDMREKREQFVEKMRHFDKIYYRDKFTNPLDWTPVLNAEIFGTHLE